METLQRPPDSVALSSSPAFATPLHPLLPTQAARQPPPPPIFKPSIPTVLPILLPPPTLRPLAFRTFTKKHNLTLNSSALQSLASFIGRHCGSAWREEGTAEKVLDEVAKLWKAEAGPVIVDDGDRMRIILKTLEGCMAGGRVVGAVKAPTSLSRQSSYVFGNDDSSQDPQMAHRPSLGTTRSDSFGMSKLHVEGEDVANQVDDMEEEGSQDPRAWLKVHSAFEQPRFSYDADKKHFVPLTARPSMFPSASHKTALFRERYNIIYQRLLRNEAFQTPTFSSHSNGLFRQNATTAQQFYKITPVANLLGRGGTSHLLLGMLAVAPTGTLALTDLSGSISLDLQHAQPLRGEDSSFFCPGMIVLVDGVYEEDWAGAGSSGLGNTGGVGGTIGGRFLGFNIGGPPVERRHVSLGTDLNAGDVGGGFGWTDFLGCGSERAIGSRMCRLEQRLLGPQSEHAPDSDRRKMVVLSEVTLDQPQTLSALRSVLEQYSSSVSGTPMTFLLVGNFASTAAMAGADTGSIEYKEMFNELATVLSDFSSLLRSSTWIFVPGDNDAWSSAFSAGATALIPKSGVPDLFTSRIRRAFATANSDALGASKKDSLDGSAIWTSNPCRLSFFGPAHELVVFRDDISGRFRRSAVRIGQAVQTNDHERSIQQDGNAQNDEDVTMSGALAPTSPDPEIAMAMTIDSPAPTSPPAEVATAVDNASIVEAKKLILSLLPQSTLSPFPLTTRPVHWDYASALSLYPLPHTIVLADAEATPFAMTFEGCHVINPGRLVSGGGRRKKVQWAEYDCWTKRATLKETWTG